MVLLKAALAQKKEPSPLCLDKSDVDRIFDTGCEIAVPELDNYWILVTSRLGYRKNGIEWKSAKNLLYNR